MSKQIIITIDRKGATAIEAEGFTGTSCLDATKSFEDALQGVTVERENKPEMYESGTDQESVAQSRF